MLNQWNTLDVENSVIISKCLVNKNRFLILIINLNIIEINEVNNLFVLWSL